MIKIVTEKSVKDFTPYRKIISIEGIKTKEELPINYLQGYPYFYFNPQNNEILLRDSDGKNAGLYINDYMFESVFQEHLRTIKKSIERYKKIKKYNAMLLKEWHGQEIFEL
ncbi:hypothetical protein [Thermoanaerobacterium butyriciformans]|uniref:Uncharacterized protein n=1 Tax=Thermoanaerobacterium butyriciformans TaxID=1702242 RepID=A0ABS4NAS3_9THEO|nr:hypothetical protein [Thermoanaerobacterium butyriciformans]MBP2070761.1 hypothetical protein [Thermoanaerobacterium butyriciformans]